MVETEYRLGHLIDCPVGRVDVIGDPGIGLPALHQQVTHPKLRIGTVEQGTPLRALQALHDPFGRAIEADHQTGGGQHLAIAIVDQASAAGGDHQAGALSQINTQ